MLKTPKNTLAKQKPSPPKTSLLAIGAGNMLAAMTISGFIIGYFVDYLVGTIPLFLLSFGLLGTIGGMLKVKDIMTGERGTKNKKPSTKPKN